MYQTVEVSAETRALFDKHRPIIENAINALQKREFFAQYPEDVRAYPETADADGKAAFEKFKGKAFTRLKQASDSKLTSDEVSPYTQEKLDITYPIYQSADSYVFRATKAMPRWKGVTPAVRAGVLVECLERIKGRFFEIAYATMHTTGQAFMMSFQASGPHANDRALEAIALGYAEQTRYPETVQWDKPMGKVTVSLKKHFKSIPRGVALAIGCLMFPVWNSLPGIFASLVTGNPVIVKPHPRGILPLAICVAEMQAVLVENGFDAQLVMLAADSEKSLKTKTFVKNPFIKIIDFTGGNAFGDYVESLAGRITFTEKAGVNSVIIDSTNDLNAMMQNLAFSVSLYSGQMCTAPQNIFIPKDGIKVGEEVVPYEKVAEAFVNAVKGLTTHPKAAPAICGAIQNENTLNRMKDAIRITRGKVLLESQPIAIPDFPNARTATPLIIELNGTYRPGYWQEFFGPIVMLVVTDNTEQSIKLAQALAKEKGAISCAAYSTDEKVMDTIADAMAEVATPVSFNLTGPIYVNQNASFSDFHVTGGNPSGNASFTDTAFVAKRFTTVGVRVM